ncbi:5-formyltetrahydrofolate cyclo-ligase-like isoform X2 [Varroa jacobsoni]|uniref:5-formyltetrahydrofolate cyclo-ligase-like isoform X2 n=1 Tax=Varroa jacobsoni TaxID=62625 RepID=UPI000BF27C60|nr:5-formyltetrahydrofolate cyclo-ligase-like isoform X2 [Varroa jacobsoni]
MATTLAQAKTALRRTIKAKLKALDAADIAAQSQIVIEKLRALEAFQRARSVSIFVSLPHEVETRGIIREMLRTGKRVFLPRYSNESLIPVESLYSSYTTLL